MLDLQDLLDPDELGFGIWNLEFGTQAETDLQLTTDTEHTHQALLQLFVKLINLFCSTTILNSTCEQWHLQ